MKQRVQKQSEGDPNWLIFFYSVPAKPVSSRMKVWRKLMKYGAVQLKGAVYILPFSEEHFEFLQWLAAEVTEMKGESGLVKVEHIETMNASDIRALFDAQRVRDYDSLERQADELEMKINSIRKGGRTKNTEGLSEQIGKLMRVFDDIRKVDFFKSGAGRRLQKRLESLKADAEKFTKTVKEEKRVTVLPVENPEEYHGRVWVTRKRPFVDRMASAWLIKKFIDKKAVFGFIEEHELPMQDRLAVAFDVKSGAFTHAGDLCTFEVLTKAFGIKDKAVKKMAEIVHEIDMKDEKFRAPEVQGIEGILSGIRKTGKDDADILEKGMAVFEMLYASKD